jgi:hypothetical protein
MRALCTRARLVAWISHDSVECANHVNVLRVCSRPPLTHHVVLLLSQTPTHTRARAHACTHAHTHRHAHTHTHTHTHNSMPSAPTIPTSPRTHLHSVVSQMKLLQPSQRRHARRQRPETVVRHLSGPATDREAGRGATQRGAGGAGCCLTACDVCCLPLPCVLVISRCLETPR